MADHAEVDVFLYEGLTTDEKAKVRAIESKIVHYLVENGNTDRLAWAREPDKQVIRLFGTPGTLTEMSEAEFAAMSSAEILKKIKGKPMFSEVGVKQLPHNDNLGEGCHSEPARKQK